MAKPSKPTRSYGPSLRLVLRTLWLIAWAAGCVGVGTGGQAGSSTAGPSGVENGSEDIDGEPDSSDAGPSNAEDSSPDDGPETIENDNQSADGGSSAPAFEDPPTDDLLEGTRNAEYLGTLAVAHVSAGGRTFLVWQVDDPATRQRGLMHVTEDELADLPDGRARGMLFVYDRDNSGGFWMRDTIVALDIAFIDASGEIVTIHTMAPFDESVYSPTGPYRCALEVVADTFAKLGVEVGDSVELP